MKMSGARNFSFQLRERKGGEDYLISGGRFIFLCFALEKKQEKKKKSVSLVLLSRLLLS